MGKVKKLIDFFLLNFLFLIFSDTYSAKDTVHSIFLQSYFYTHLKLKALIATLHLQRCPILPVTAIAEVLRLCIQKVFRIWRQHNRLNRIVFVIADVNGFDTI